MLSGEQCLSILTPDQQILLCPPPQGKYASDAEALNAPSGNANLQAYLNYVEPSGSTTSTGIPASLAAFSNSASSSNSSPGRKVYIQLTNFRFVINFFGDGNEEMVNN